MKLSSQFFSVYIFRRRPVRESRYLAAIRPQDNEEAFVPIATIAVLCRTPALQKIVQGIGVKLDCAAQNPSF